MNGFIGPRIEPKEERALGSGLYRSMKRSFLRLRHIPPSSVPKADAGLQPKVQLLGISFRRSAENPFNEMQPYCLTCVKAR
jgi:hypothetical protein